MIYRRENGTTLSESGYSGSKPQQEGRRGSEKTWETGLLFAPAERNVYRRAKGPRTALQRSAMWKVSESGCSGLKDSQDSRRENQKTRERGSGIAFSPRGGGMFIAERHGPKHTKAPEECDMWEVV